MSKPAIIAHRGAMNVAPENTFSAFQKALELGADGIELDLHFSRDNKLIVHHDYTFKKETGSNQAIYELNASEIKKIDIGSWFDTSFSFERPLFFEEVLELVAGKCSLEAELKGSNAAFIEKTIQVARSFGLLNQIEFTSPHAFILQHLQVHYPGVKCGVFIENFPGWLDPKIREKIVIDHMSLSGYQIAHFPLPVLNTHLVAKLHAMNKIVHAANCDTSENIAKALLLNVDQFSTRNVLLAQEILFES